MSVNVKLGTNTINGVDVVKLEDATTSGTYHNFTLLGHPFIIYKNAWGGYDTITVSIVDMDTSQTWTHTFNLSGSYADYYMITYEDLVAAGWSGNSCDVTITVSRSSAANNTTIGFLGFMSSVAPSANAYSQSVDSNTLTVHMTTSADPISANLYTCCALITCGLKRFE